jgi:cell volume regulation protein A
VFRDFELDPSLPVKLVCDFYNLPPPAGSEQPLGDWMAAELRRPPVAGDSLTLGSATLVVRELADGRISRVGLGLPD